MQQTNWQAVLQNSIKSPQSLAEHLELQADQLGISETAEKSFPFQVTENFSKRMRKGDPDDPLLRQVLPVVDETINHPAYSKNPLAEDNNQPLPGILHKYHGRALLIVTGACAIHCRYCFRRHFPYSDAGLSSVNQDMALDYLASNHDITEIILSGGDPLTLNDERLSNLVSSLSEIEHIKRIRIHTRIPVVLPERVSNEFISLLNGTRLRPVIVLHINHANEVDEKVIEAIIKLRSAKIPLLNQSVLLKGVNDNAKTLAQLSEKLFDSGIIPYYLHMLDPVAGSAHYEVREDRARKIMQELYNTLPGYLVPRLVREIPGKSSKIPVDLAVK